MTAGQALELARDLRPGSCITAQTRMQWLRELDGMLRQTMFRKASTEDFDAVGADLAWDEGLQDEDRLLVPEPFDALYPHYLCARNDAALGETDRYAGEQAQYNALAAELAVWLRQNYPPRSRAQWRW